MVTSDSLVNSLHIMTSVLKIPVIIILFAMMIITVISAGALIGEYFTERRHLRAKLPELVDIIKAHTRPTEDSIAASQLLEHQKNALNELT